MYIYKLTWWWNRVFKKVFLDLLICRLQEWGNFLMPHLLCNAFLSIFTVCLLGSYPHHLGNEEEKKRERRRRRRRSKKQWYSLQAWSLTVKWQSTNLAITPSMFINKRTMGTNPLPTTTCPCPCSTNWTRTGWRCRRVSNGTARGAGKRRRINAEVIKRWCWGRVGTAVG